MLNRYAWIVFKKEIKDIFRDKKTIIMSIILPIVIFPIIAMAMGGGMKDNFNPDKPSPIAVMGEKSELYEALTKIPNIEIIDTENPEKDLSDLKIHAYVKTPKGFDGAIKDNKVQEVEVVYDPTSSKSAMALSKIKEVLNELASEKAKEKLEALNIDAGIMNLVPIKPVASSKEETGMGMMMLSMILPMLLAVYAASGGIPAAVDLGAGEKERQTLEPLLTTHASRNALIMGKFSAVVLTGILGTVASLVGFFLATIISPEMYGQAGTMPVVNILLIALFAFLLCNVFSALELVVSFYARNFKEAQTYLTPFTFVVLIPAYFTMFLDGKLIPPYYLHIPVLNTIAIIKEILVGIISLPHILIVLAWGIVYVTLSILLVRKIIHKESVIFRN